MVSQSFPVVNVMVLTAGFSYTGTGTNNGKGHESALIWLSDQLLLLSGFEKLG